jgi:glucokinase
LAEGDVDDEVLLGLNGLAAELGHVTILPDGPMCGCGQRHLEALSSGTAIARWTEQLPAAIVAIMRQPISRKWLPPPGQAIRWPPAIERAGSYLGLALANYLHIFNPSIIIIGGGVSQSGPLLMDPIWTAIKKNILSPYYLEHLTLTRAGLGDEAGLLGALALAHTVA